MARTALKEKVKPQAKKPALVQEIKKRGELIVHQARQPKTMLEVIADASRSKDVDVPKMKELREMWNDEKALMARQSFIAALREVQIKLTPILKDSKNPHTQSKFATLAKISKVVDPILHEHGFGLTYGMADSPIENHYRITADLMHVDGHIKPYLVDLPADIAGPKGTANKSATQGVGSTISYGRRYLKTMIVDVPLADEDDDGSGAKTITEKQVGELTKMCEKAQITKDQFCQAFSVSEYEHLPAKRFDEAKKRIQTKLDLMEDGK